MPEETKSRSIFEKPELGLSPGKLKTLMQQNQEPLEVDQTEIEMFSKLNNEQQHKRLSQVSPRSDDFTKDEKWVDKQED